MVMKSSSKTSVRLVKKHITRLLTVIAIVFVSVGFMMGVGEVDGKINTAVYGYYLSNNVSDFYVKSDAPTGFTDSDIAWFENRFGKSNISKSFCLEVDCLAKVDEVTGEEVKTDVRLYYLGDLENLTINKLDLLDGRYPTESNEIAVERKTTGLIERKLGDKITVDYTGISPYIGKIEYTVVGVVVNPMHITTDAEKSFLTADENDLSVGENLEGIYYLNALPDVMNMMSGTKCNDVYVTLKDRTLFSDTISNDYENLVKGIEMEIASSLDIEDKQVLTLFENFGIYTVCNYAHKIGIISIIFVIFFLLVTILVVYSTMSRLLTEERAQIACQKTLGYTDFQILAKYILFVLIGTVIGALLAFPLGYGLTRIVYSAFYIKYAMPIFPATIKFEYYIIVSAITLFFTIFLTVFTGFKTVKNKPATLLTPKAPRSGKKVILERIPFIWNRLSFKYKSTFRNVLLFKSRFLMTVVSIIGSAILVFCGLGIMDCTLSIPEGEPLKAIAAVLIIFSAALCALVIYNLTNINVSERNREIATLMVLGYNDKEVTGYIFREVYIMSIIGAIVGLPLGVAFISFVFKLIEFGTLDKITWLTYVLSPCLVMAFSFLSTLLLRKKITKTDMNVSLKTLD